MSYFEDCKFEGSLLLRAISKNINVDQVISQTLRKIEKPPLIITAQKRINSFKTLQDRYNSLYESAFIFTKNTKLDEFYEQKPCSTIILDCLGLLIELIGVDSVAKIIYKLKEKAKLVIVFADYSTITASNWDRLKGVADNYVNIATLGDLIDCEGMTTKKNGKMTPIKEVLELTNNGLKKVQWKDILSEIQIEQEQVPSSFNMGTELKDSEKSAKAALQLPYTSTNAAEELVNLRLSEKKVRVGGQIIYTPDDADDLDDEDPDDDLNI